MEDPCKLVCFGGSILKSATPVLERQLKSRYPNYRIKVVDASVEEETTNGALARIDEICSMKPTCCVIALGVNDLRNGVERRQFRSNLSKIIAKLSCIETRVLLATMLPDAQDSNSYRASSDLLCYNEDIRDIALHKKIRICDVFSLWQKRSTRVRNALHNDFHPNDIGIKCTVESIMRMITRSYTTVVWQFNGEECFCNYACPYCYVSSNANTGHHWRGEISGWHRGFLEAFGCERIMFYLSFGEPMAGKRFYSVIDMIASEPHWAGHMTSNLSLPLDRLITSRLVREGRFFVNASYHPTQTSPQAFLDKLLALRASGIEPAVVYVMYPPQMYDIFDEAFQLFNSNGFLIHIRRFRGTYNGKYYPQAYTESQRIRIAKYADDATIAYMLNDFEDGRTSLLNRPTYAGVYYIMVDNEGDVWQTPDYHGPAPMGNVLKGNVKLLAGPEPFAGSRDGTVDGLMSFLDFAYEEPKGNHVASFSKQGGVRREGDRVVYGNMETDFQNRFVRRRLNWPTHTQLIRFRTWAQMRKIRKHTVRYTTPLLQFVKRGIPGFFSHG